MRRVSSILIWFSFPLASTGLVQRAAAQFDQVYPLRGAPTNGRIIEMSRTAVTVEVQGNRREIEVTEIRRITFADDPQELRRARDDALSGQLEAGLEELKKIDGASIQRDLVAQDLQYYLAYCQGKLALSGGGDKSAAHDALLAFVSAHSNSYHFFEAAELLGDLAVATESYDRAVKYYAAIGQAPWPDYQMRAAVLEARTLVAQGEFNEAQAKYESIIGTNVDTAQATRQKSFAQVGKAVCLAETGDHQQGIAIIEALIAKNDPQDSELFGRAYNGLGRCYVKANQTKDALLAYLHVDILFYSQPDVHAEALYNLSKLWAAVNKPDRAISARNLLTDRYAGSVWAKRE